MNAMAMFSHAHIYIHTYVICVPVCEQRKMDRRLTEFLGSLPKLASWQTSVHAPYSVPINGQKSPALFRRGLQKDGVHSTCSLHCSSFLGLPFGILNIELVKPTKGTTMETIGMIQDLS